MSTIDDIFDLFTRIGDASYLGEFVSQTDHALQTAFLAEQDGAENALVVAALLHDFGHLCQDPPENIGEPGVNTGHEHVGATGLQLMLGPGVTEPIRLHVAAKRYLCAVEPEYLATLSPASIQSLKLQGGPFSLAQVQRFEQTPYHQNAVRLRRWDDAAKDPELKVPGLNHYRLRLEKEIRG